MQSVLCNLKIVVEVGCDKSFQGCWDCELDSFLNKQIGCLQGVLGS